MAYCNGGIPLINYRASLVSKVPQEFILFHFFVFVMSYHLPNYAQRKN